MIPSVGGCTYSHALLFPRPSYLAPPISQTGRKNEARILGKVILDTCPFILGYIAKYPWILFRGSSVGRSPCAAFGKLPVLLPLTDVNEREFKNRPSVVTHCSINFSIVVSVNVLHIFKSTGLKDSKSWHIRFISKTNRKSSLLSSFVPSLRYPKRATLIKNKSRTPFPFIYGMK